MSRLRRQSVIGLIPLLVVLLWLTFGNHSEIIAPHQASSPSISSGSAVESTSSAGFQIPGEEALVTKVIDGDTIEVNLNGQLKKVRYLGMDTPETKDPRRPVGCFGKEASAENKKLVDGKTVILQKDISEKDMYDRLLRYIFVPLGKEKFLFVNDYLVREGFAKVLTYPPDVKYNERLLEAQRQAKAGNRGLWGSCPKGE